MEKVIVSKSIQDKIIHIASKSAQDEDENDKKKKSCNEITIKEFLDFLRTAYQVNDSVEDTLASVEGTTEAVDWIKLKNSDLVRPKTISCQTSNTNIASDAIQMKLDEVLNEGLFDSVLPYMVPVSSSKKSLNSKFSDKSTSVGNSVRTSASKESVGRRKSSDGQVKIVKTDSEIEIHVCDEVKNQRKDFICSQKLLVEKMGYFADVTSGQKLEDMDISVHCDIGIFEWLMRWVKKDFLSETEAPQLNVQNVIPILVSAAFLQMDPLLQDCLLYCHENLNEILQSTTNLNCLNDSIITRLASMYTNTELEAIKDKRDKIQSRLYCKMIMSLCDVNEESVRGHWNTLAYIYRCAKCEQLVMPEVEDAQPCQPSCMSIDRNGDVISHHVRDPLWNLNEYVTALQTELKSWRKVYWRLWAECHYLECTVCELPFPAHKVKWCCFHPEQAQFFTVDSQKAPLPVGRFPCCSERAYRFQLVSNHSGCRFREHVPATVLPRDAAVVGLVEMFRDVIDVEPPELMFPERLTRLVAKDPTAPDGKLLCKETFWWEGLQLTPAHQKQGLLGIFNHNNSSQQQQQQSNVVAATTTTTKTENITDFSSDDSSTSSTTSNCTSDQSEEETSRQSQKPVLKRKLNRKKKTSGQQWQLNLSARSNQDLQRAQEEQLVSKMAMHLSKKMNIEGSARHKGWQRHVTPPGGVYVRLESEWKEQNASKRSYMHKSKIRATRLV